MKLLRAGSAIFLAVAVLHCGSAPSVPPPDPVPEPQADAGEDAGVDAGPVAVVDAGNGCLPHQHPGEDGGCTSTLTWTAGPSLPAEAARDHHVTFIFEGDAGAYLGIAGGVAMGTTSDKLFSDVYVSHLGADGQPEAWVRSANRMTVPMGGAGLAIAGQRIYMMGGIATPSSLTNQVVSAPLLPSGQVGVWREETRFLAPVRYHLGAFAHGDFVYLLAGFDGHGVFGDVQRARIGPNGVLGAWEQTTALPSPRSHHAVAMQGDSVYVVGGWGMSGPFKEVLRSTLAADGTLGAWVKVADLPTARRTHSATFVDDALYVLNGEDGDGSHLGNAVTEVLRAPLLPDGTLGAFSVVSDPSPSPRRHTHQAPAWNGRLYSVAGSDAAEVPRSACSVAELH